MLYKKLMLITLATFSIVFGFSGTEVMAQEDTLAETQATDIKDIQRESEKEKGLEVLQTENSVEFLTLAGVDVVGGTADEETPVLPSGISYNSTTNTVTLNNVNIESEVPLVDYYSGSADLTVELIGENVYTAAGVDSAGIWESLYASGDVYIKGPGSLEVKNKAYIFGQSFNEDGGDLYIDGATLISDGEGLISQYSNITIRNATLDINCQKDPLDGACGGYAFGICTGRTESNDEDVSSGTTPYGGVLTIENSEIEIKNFFLPIAANQLKISGCSFYGGDSSAEFKIDPTRVYLENAKRLLYDSKYMKFSKEELDVPDAYYIYTSDNEYGYIDSKPYEYMSVYQYFVDYAYMGAGQTVDLQIYPDEGCRLKQIYVNNKPISGTSFVMPERDTEVYAVFEKIPSTSQKITSISINGLSKKIAAGKKVQLSTSVVPENAANKVVTWKSSNAKVATVNASGVVTMKKKSGGKSVTITATAQDGSGVKATYKIKSMKGVVKKVSISGKKTVKAGKILKLKGKVKATKSANKKLKWTSSNTRYAKVTSSGKVKTYKAGKGKKVKITAMATDGSGKKKSVTIKIK